MLQIVGIIRATSHIHQTDPNREGNESRTLKTFLWGSDQRRHLVPYVTANSIRGQLRRAAANRVLDAMNVPVSRALFSVLTTGKASRKDVGLTPTTRAMVDGGAHPFAGLFGGGGYMLPSRYTMGPLLPAVAWCNDALHPAVRAQAIPLDRLTRQLDDGSLRDVDLTTQLILTSRDDIMAGKGQQYIQDYQTSVDAWLGAVVDSRAAKAANKAAKEDAKKKGEKVEVGNGKAISIDNSGYNLIEAMLPGTPLQFWMRFNPKASDAQIGLMLLAIRDWANANVIGGASARGFGRFEATLALYDDDTEIVPTLFNISDHATAYTFTQGVEAYVKAAEEALASATPDELEGVYATHVAGI